MASKQGQEIMRTKSMTMKISGNFYEIGESGVGSHRIGPMYFVLFVFLICFYILSFNLHSMP